MSQPTPNKDCKRKPKSQAGKQVRQKTIQQIEKLKSISKNFVEFVPTVAPEAPTQIFNPQEFKTKEINNFDEFSFFFENLLDKTVIDKEIPAGKTRVSKGVQFQIITSFTSLFLTHVYCIFLFDLFTILYH